MLRILACALAMLCTSPAFAAEPEQSSLVRAIDFGTLSTYSVDSNGALLGAAECEKLVARTSEVIVTFDLTVDPTEVDGSVQRLDAVWLYELAPSDRAIDCDSAACLPLDVEVQADSTGVEVALDPQTILQGAGCIADRDVFVRIDLVKSFEDDDDLTSADARLRFDVTGPKALAIEFVDATDNLIEVELSAPIAADSDMQKWHIGWIEAAATPGSAADLTRLGTSDAAVDRRTLDGVELPVDTLIHIYVWGEDEVGNAGELSEPYPVEPVDALDYWEAYGGEHGGCASVSGSSTLLGLLSGVLLLARRRRRWFVVAVIVLLPSLAQAQNGVVELRLGSYTPVVAGTAGFAEYFGPHMRWMASVDGAWLFATTPVAILGVDTGLGYSHFNGNALTDSRVFEDGSSLTVVPMRLGLRALSGNWSRWLVLGLRGGITGQYYRFGNPGGVSRTANGVVGRGLQWGWYSSGQLALDLTGADRESAAKLKSHWSVSRTLLFVEVAYSDVDDFGTSQLNLGDLQLNGGLGFAF